MIRTELIGCVGQDAVLRDIAGNMYACFDLAVKERAKGEEKTTWVRVRKLDREQKLTQYITKGKAIFVEGRPQVSAYLNKESRPACDLTVWADRMEFVSGAGNGGSQQQTGYAQSAPQQQYHQPQPQYQPAAQPQQQYYQPQPVAVADFDTESEVLPF